MPRIRKIVDLPALIMAILFLLGSLLYVAITFSKSQQEYEEIIESKDRIIKSQSFSIDLLGEALLECEEECKGQ